MIFQSLHTESASTHHPSIHVGSTGWPSSRRLARPSSRFLPEGNELTGKRARHLRCISIKKKKKGNKLGYRLFQIPPDAGILEQRD